jgi:HEAT repeat protein
VTDAGPVARAAELAALGHRRSLPREQADFLVSAVVDDPDPRVRAAALGALVRGAPRRALPAWSRAVDDPTPVVRRRAAELAPAVGGVAVPALLDLLDDPDVTVVEAAAWATGELGRDAIEHGAVTRLAHTAGGHRDALARESAVAALGALGDAGGLAAILVACRDKPAVRRRAVLALAPFDGPEVDAALAAALTDRDWQVRQAAEDLRGDG